MQRFSIFCLIAAASTLAACGDVREDLGLGRNPPDEFAVIDRPPLTIPPDFGIRPPRPGAPRPQNVDITQQAGAVLYNGHAPAASDTVSPGEQALLVATGATKADPNIRNTIDRETAQKVVASPHLVEQLMDFGDDQKPALTVDAVAEAKRIKEAQQNDEPLNKGATPVIEKQQSGLLGL